LPVSSFTVTITIRTQLYFRKGLVIPVAKSVVPKDPDAVIALKNLKDKVQNEIQKYRRGAADIRPRRHPHANDFFRLARRICGRSIGLVLGGGGARGIAHLVSELTDVDGTKG
jgi:lysophospholipid hydrolase